jgi:hypothetical protein
MVDPGTQAVVEFFDEAPPALADLAGAYPNEVTILRASAFNAADPTTTEVLVLLTPVVLRSLTLIVREHIAARKHVTIKVDGIELTGLDRKDAVAVLTELAERDQTK